MRLDCPELRQVRLVYRVLRQVNQFYLALVRRTKVLALVCTTAAQTPVCRGIDRSVLGDRKLLPGQLFHFPLCGFYLPMCKEEEKKKPASRHG